MRRIAAGRNLAALFSAARVSQPGAIVFLRR
jgi:hypothetical protein